MSISDQGAKVGQTIGHGGGIPHADLLVMSRRDDVSMVLGPHNAVDGPYVCFVGGLAGPAGSWPVGLRHAHHVIRHIQDSERAGAPSDIPQSHGAVNAAAAQNVLVTRRPRHGQDGAGVSGQRMRAGAGAQVDKAHDGMLGGAGHQQMGGDGRQRVRVDDGVEIERGCGRAWIMGRVDLEGVIVRGREEGVRVKGVEAQMGDAEAVTRGCFSSRGIRFPTAVSFDIYPGWRSGLP